MADIGPTKIPDSVTDEQALFLSDVFPTGYMAAENAQIRDGDTVAIWGCGPKPLKQLGSSAHGPANFTSFVSDSKPVLNHP